MIKRIATFLILLGWISLVSTGCNRVSSEIEPEAVAIKHPKEIHREKRYPLHLPEDFSCNPFPQLTEDELGQDWGKEYYLAQQFAKEFDLYRAITNFKRSLYLCPLHITQRREEIYYHITLAYFLGRKYGEVIYSVQSTPLKDISTSFPAYRDLLLILQESYTQIGNKEMAQLMLQKLEMQLPDIAAKVALCAAVRSANFVQLEKESQKRPYIGNILANYKRETKSVRKAEFLNACLPGAGYWYLGQKQTAITAVFINGLFLGTAGCFYAYGNIPAAIVSLSFEGGWYFGGIYGAGLSAKEYNERIYAGYAEKIYQKEQCFPSMMLRYSF